MKTVALAAVLAVAPVVAAAGTIGAYSDLVVFGDSLSDPGNTFLVSDGTVPTPLFYPNGQFTDGETWAAKLGAGLASGTNFARAGALAATNADTIPDFAAQLAQFSAAAPVLGDRPLAAVFFGGNDLRSAATPAAAAAAITAAAGAIATGIEDLIDAGLTDILVLGLPNLGRLPEFAGTGFEPVLTAASVAFNDTLQAAIAPLGAQADVAYFDTFMLFESLFDDPAAYGLTNTDDACLALFPACSAASADGFVFFDAIHPTDRVHAILAQAVAAQVAPVPLPASLPLFAGGLVLVALLRRRRAEHARNP